MRVFHLVLLTCLAASACVPALAAGVPSWRGKSPGTAYLGPDVLWRPRERLFFHMLDDKGTGFTLTVTARDMNVYLQGPRPVAVWVEGPQGDTVAQGWLDDDGVIAGNGRYHDGVYDPWQDFRYREWARSRHDGNDPPRALRAPALTHPERLAPRELTVQVPAAGKGLYRVMVAASWDHWISVTPDRPLVTGVHPGAGPLYLYGAHLQEMYLYTLPNVQDINFTLSEEIKPFNWTLTVQDEAGKVVGQTTPRGFMSYTILQRATPKAVYRLRAAGTTTGACLHLYGTAMLLCPDAATARKLQGGAQVDAKGRVTFHQPQRVLNAWVDGLRPADLAVGLPEKLPAAYAAVPALLASQDLDPASATYGQFKEEKADFWNQPVDRLASIAGSKAADNPFYGHPGLIRRILLCRAQADLSRLSAFCWFELAGDAPWTFNPAKADEFWGAVAMRSSYFGLGHDAKHYLSLKPIKDLLEPSLPKAVIAAWKQCFDCWPKGRLAMHAGECSNQWCENLSYIAHIYEITGTKDLLTMLDQQIGILTTPGQLGRMNPDVQLADVNTGTGYTLTADTGALGCGSLSDGHGFDAEYCNEQVLFVAGAWNVTKDPRLLAWWDRYATLKAHLALPTDGKTPTGALVSPTDMNHRTVYPHAAMWLPEDAKPLVPSWKLMTDLPCLQEGTFTKIIDRTFYFLKTPAYYATAYAGNGTPSWAHFGVTEIKDGTISVKGYSGMHYTGLGRKASKLAGISSIFVKNCGPTLFCSNSDVMYTNAVWGKSAAPVMELFEKDHVDPHVICSGYGDQVVTFDDKSRLYRTSTVLEDAPLAVTRTIQYKDDRVLVTLDLTATDDLALTELWETIPYYLTGRTVRPYDDAFAAGAANPAEGTLTCRALDISGNAGAGLAMIFDAPVTGTQAKTLPLSRGLGAMRSFSLPLNHRLRAGERQTIRYILYPHDAALTAETLRQVAATSW